MSEAQVELLRRHRQTLAELREQIGMMEAFQRGEGGFGTHAENFRDTTTESIAKATAAAAELEEFISRFDPEVATD
jgi:hypothetical protein